MTPYACETFDEVNRERGTYWGHKGTYASLMELLRARIPFEGSVVEPRKNRALEKLRKAINCYYDMYNNGMGNRDREFYGVFKEGCRWIHARTLENKMDEIILAAGVEQGFVSRI